MIESKGDGSSVHNRILAALPVKEYKRLLPQLELVELRLGKVLYQPSEPIRHVYFPNRGAISLVVMMEDGTQVEIGLIGNEGMLGLAVALGTDSTPHLAVVQIAGEAMKMSIETLREEVKRCSPLYHALLRYAEALFIQTAQTAACNRHHHLDSRLARWLLMSQDRAKSENIGLTQELIATMLGVRRAGVTVAAATLREAGIIRYSRGKIHILNRERLEKAACECYVVVRNELDRLLMPA